MDEEFNLLECSLKDLGLYEKGMNLEDMRTIQSVLDESIRESSDIYEEQLQAAILESEQTASDSFHRSCEASTSYGSLDNSSSCYSSCGGRSFAASGSPDCSHIIQVEAEVHAEPQMEVYLLNKNVGIDVKNMKNEMQADKTDNKGMLCTNKMENTKSSADIYGYGVLEECNDKM